MLRKFLIALIALVGFAGLTISQADARGGGWHGARAGGWHGARGWHGHGWRGGWGHRRFVGPRFYGAPLAYYGGYNSCYRVRYVPTPYGWVPRRVWVCGYPYY